MEAVPIINVVKDSISSADIVTDPIISTSLIISKETWWKTYTLASIAIKIKKQGGKHAFASILFTNLYS